MIMESASGWSVADGLVTSVVNGLWSGGSLRSGANRRRSRPGDLDQGGLPDDGLGHGMTSLDDRVLPIGALDG